MWFDSARCFYGRTYAMGIIACMALHSCPGIARDRENETCARLTAFVWTDLTGCIFATHLSKSFSRREYSYIFNKVVTGLYVTHLQNFVVLEKFL